MEQHDRQRAWVRRVGARGDVLFLGYYYPRKQVSNIVLDNLDPSVLKGL
jgi:hypothetical protein